MPAGTDPAVFQSIVIHCETYTKPRGGASFSCP